MNTITMLEILCVVAIGVSLGIWIAGRRSRAERPAEQKDTKSPDGVGDSDEVVWSLGKSRPIVELPRRALLKKMVGLAALGLIAGTASKGRFVPWLETMAGGKQAGKKRKRVAPDDASASHADGHFDHADNHTDQASIPHTDQINSHNDIPDSPTHDDSASPGHTDVVNHSDTSSVPHIDEHADYHNDTGSTPNGGGTPC